MELNGKVAWAFTAPAPGVNSSGTRQGAAMRAAC